MLGIFYDDYEDNFVDNDYNIKMNKIMDIIMMNMLLLK